MTANHCLDRSQVFLRYQFRHRGCACSRGYCAIIAIYAQHLGRLPFLYCGIAMTLRNDWFWRNRHRCEHQGKTPIATLLTLRQGLRNQRASRRGRDWAAKLCIRHFAQQLCACAIIMARLTSWLRNAPNHHLVDRWCRYAAKSALRHRQASNEGSARPPRIPDSACRCQTVQEK